MFDLIVIWVGRSVHLIRIETRSSGIDDSTTVKMVAIPIKGLLPLSRGVDAIATG